MSYPSSTKDKETENMDVTSMKKGDANISEDNIQGKPEGTKLKCKGKKTD